MHDDAVYSLFEQFIDHQVYDRNLASFLMSSAAAKYHTPASAYENELNYAWDVKAGVCEDFAALFTAFCTRAGISCETVSGQANSDGHSFLMNG